METISLFYKTILLRPYVFIFLIVFLVAGFLNIGKKRTFVFLGITWIIAFLCEYSSTRNGFPFGLYHYTEKTQGQELFFSNVPFFDSLSFTFLLFAAYSISLFMLSPLKVEKRNVEVAHTFSIRQSQSVLILTMFYMLMIDVVIDPVALRGERWFLGHIYDYEYHGYYFGVPLTNACGWAVVGLISLLIYQKVEKRLFVGEKNKLRKSKVPYHSLMGIGLYYGILFFMLGVCLWIEERALLIASIFVFLLPTVLMVLRFLDPKNRVTSEEYEKHCEEFFIT